MWGYEPVAFSDPLEVMSALEGPDSPQLVVLDWMMPNLDGIDICRKIRERSDTSYTYVILVSGRVLKEDAVIALEAGADDFIAKPYYPEELEMRLRSGKRILDLQASLLTAQEALKYQASRDALTGLWNRSGILSILERELSRTVRDDQCVAVMLIDVDLFKPINDTYGHLCGDAVLREVAQRILNSIRPYDSLGRFGGDELLLVIPASDQPNLKSVAERIRTAVADTEITMAESRISVTISVGVTIATKGRKVAIEEIIQSADQALYLAKRQGRNSVIIAADCGL
jgi:diguanylate cyclase (GGDEF)-like protein